MYVKLNEVQPKLEKWIKNSWKEGKWGANAVINSEGEIIDARVKGGLRPSPVTRDLTWGVPVPVREGEESDGMEKKVLCEYRFFATFVNQYSTFLSRCLGIYDFF